MSISKSQKRRFSNKGCIIVGVDVAKNTHVGRILFPDGSESKPLPFNNNRKGFDEFIQWFFSQKETQAVIQ